MLCIILVYVLIVHISLKLVTHGCNDLKFNDALGMLQGKYEIGERVEWMGLV